MKTKIVFFVLALITMMFSFCTKEGPRGPRGPAGADGSDGNANVITYLFTNPATINWSSGPIHSIYLYYDTSFVVPDSIRNDGVILVYMQYENYGTAWYQSPGLGPDGRILTRIWITDNFLRIYALDPDGSDWTGGSTAYNPSTIKVILISASEAKIIARMGLTPEKYVNDMLIQTKKGH